MPIIKHCPNCGSVISDDDIEFCTECGYNLLGKPVANDSKGFFDNISEKTNVAIVIFSFVVFGAFLFIGSIFWSAFLSNGSIDLVTYLLLTVVLSVFFAGMFMGYFGCRDRSYVIPNFTMFVGSIFAVVLSGMGLIFAFSMGIIATISSAFSSLSNNSPYGAAYQPTVPSYTPSVNLNIIFEIILFILLIPVAAYFGVYLGYFLRQNI